MILAKETENPNMPLEYIEGYTGIANNVTLELPVALKEGDYVVFIEIDWVQNEVNHFFFNTYSDLDLELEKIEDNTHEDFLYKALKSCAIQREKFKDYKSNNEPAIKRAISLTSSNAEYGYVFYENKSKTSILVEKIIFSELKNLQLLPPYKGNEIDVYVEPGATELVIMKRTDRSASYNFESFASFDQPDDIVTKDIRSKGQKVQVVYKDKKYDIFYYQMNFSRGFIFLFENKSKDWLCEANFAHGENQNLHDPKDTESQKWKFRFGPKETIIKRLVITDPKIESGLSYSYGFRVLKNFLKDKDIIEMLREKGTKKQVVHEGTEYQIFYFYYFFDEYYYWFWENKEKKQEFDGQFKFQLTNLELIHDDQPSPSPPMKKNQKTPKKESSKANEIESK